MGELIEELLDIQEEAVCVGDIDVAAACKEIRGCVSRFVPPPFELVDLVYKFVGARTAQNRYGQ
jgi:hypothetical protein